MKKLITYLIVLAGAVLILDFLSYLLIDVAYQQMKVGQSGGKINLLKSKGGVNLLAVGDSRVARTIDPSSMSGDVYNLSHNGMSLAFQIGLIDVLVSDTNFKVDTILLHMEANEWTHHDGSSSSDVQYLKYFYDSNEHIRQEIDLLNTFESTKFWFRSYRFNGRVTSIINNARKSFQITNPSGLSGYEPNVPSEQDSFNVYLSATKLFDPLPVDTLYLNERNVHRIQHLKSLCDSLDVKLICFMAPSYTSKVLDRKVNAEENEMLSAFLEEEEIEFMNYYENPKRLGLQSPWDWKDALHLNDHGAKKFSKIIRSDLRKLR